MFSIEEIIQSLNNILDTEKLTQKTGDVFLIDSINKFGFSLDEGSGITIFYYGEHFHIWDSGDVNISKADIIDKFLKYVDRLLNKKITFIYTTRGNIRTRIKIVHSDNEEDVIEDYVCSINPIALLFKKKEHIQTIEFRQR